MNKRLILTLAMSASLASFGAFAGGGSKGSGAGDTGAAGAGAGGASASGAMPRFSEIDKDNDGVITKKEADTNKQLKQQFSSLDKDKDNNLSQSEYEVAVGAGAKGGAKKDSGGAGGAGGAGKQNGGGM